MRKERGRGREGKGYGRGEGEGKGCISKLGVGFLFLWFHKQATVHKQASVASL